MPQPFLSPERRQQAALAQVLEAALELLQKGSAERLQRRTGALIALAAESGGIEYEQDTLHAVVVLLALVDDLLPGLLESQSVSGTVEPLGIELSLRPTLLDTLAEPRKDRDALLGMWGFESNVVDLVGEYLGSQNAPVDRPIFVHLKRSALSSELANIPPFKPDTTLSETADPDFLAMALWKLMALKSQMTADHSLRVARFSLAIAERAEVPETDFDLLVRSALLHDIGKLALPDDLLNKSSSLEFEERAHIRTHAAVGEALLASTPELQTTASIVGRHHEKRDGSGYPLGLQGNEIDPLTSVLTAADVFDALAYARPYRAALGLDEVFAIMTGDMASALDRKNVALLQDIVAA